MRQKWAAWGKLAHSLEWDRRRISAITSEKVGCTSCRLGRMPAREISSRDLATISGELGAFDVPPSCQTSTELRHAKQNGDVEEKR